MRVLVAHTSYVQRGGEDAVVANELKLLEQMGIEAQLYSLSNSHLLGPASVFTKAKWLSSTVWSLENSRQLQDTCSVFHPDIVHFHNTFPVGSPSMYSAARKTGAAIVQTLHNFRLLCPRADFFRDGAVCEDCVHWGRVPLPAFRHACYRQSRAQTLGPVANIAFNRLRRTWQEDVDAYIALTDFSRRKFIAGGLPRDRIHIKPNFLMDTPEMGIGGDGFVFVGRLEEPKGIRTLLESVSYTKSQKITVIGSGSLSPLLQGDDSLSSQIRFRGQLPYAEVLREMRKGRALIFPSLWYEAFPMTILEAFGSGLPVIASALGSMPEIVSDGHTGLLFDPGNASDLASKIEWFSTNPEEARSMGINARDEFISKYSAERNADILSSIYESAVATRAIG